ncbi:MAG TPA: ABC transporter ATP-binding protein [Acidimicrobiales bacterium]|nr:ABC transporter ATP-binding protein [Acidimicrobiales bacterium]
MTQPSATMDAGAEVAPAAPSPLIELSGVEKVYRTGSLDYPALRGVDLEIGQGEMVSIIGPSGSGKSTILNLVTGIDKPSAGRVVVDGREVADMGQEALAAWRGTRVGIVFQFFQLLPTLTALENVILPMEFAGLGSKRERVANAKRRLEQVGLDNMGDHVPSELSGGEQQRVAIARAMACDPVLLIGDEPTGNLDSETAQRMFDLLTELNSSGTTVVYVTHDPGLAEMAGRKIEIRDGRVRHG